MNLEKHTRRSLPLQSSVATTDVGEAAKRLPSQCSWTEGLTIPRVNRNSTAWSGCTDLVFEEEPFLTPSSSDKHKPRWRTHAEQGRAAASGNSSQKDQGRALPNHLPLPLAPRWRGGRRQKQRGVYTVLTDGAARSLAAGSPELPWRGGSPHCPKQGTAAAATPIPPRSRQEPGAGTPAGGLGRPGAVTSAPPPAPPTSNVSSTIYNPAPACGSCPARRQATGAAPHGAAGARLNPGGRGPPSRGAATAPTWRGA